MASDTLISKDSVAIKASPAPPGPAVSNQWRLFYKRGGNPRCELVFSLPGDIQDAIRRGRTYCQNMNFIFIHVEKFLHDLDEDERHFNNGE